MRFTAIVDRFEGEDAVLVIEQDGEDIDELAVPKSLLPDEAQEQDAVLRVELAEDELVDVEFDPAETRRRKRRSQSRFDRLSRRLGADDEDEDET